MSKTIDERVVEMRFDNRQFESATADTLNTLDKLKRSLRFDGATEGLENISSATNTNKTNMNGFGKAVETVRMRFSALEVMGVTALANITNSAVNAGKRIVSALSIDPVMSGFREYETQINAVQTILANTESKGTTLTDVNKALDELNKYADKTIYNFTEMTRNIGTFTAAGVDLEKSVTSIKGIANLAAVSGSNAQQASTAMYQLSQALAAGKVSLMDWNSVVNAGMGGEVFQTALKRTATQMGYNVDALIKKYGSFRESLTEGEWLTAEVLTETLTQLSGAYTEADLIAQGYTKEQAKQITELAETAVNAATKVKTFTQLWDTLKEAAQSGWTQSWEILIGDFEEARDLLTNLSDTFGAIIGNISDARNELLYDALSSNWKKLTDEISEAGINVEDYKDKVIQLAKDQEIPIDNIITEYGSLEKAFKEGALSSELLDQALIGMTGSSEEISKQLVDLRGNLKTNTDVLDALTKAGYEQKDIQYLVDKAYKGQEISLNDLTDAQLMSIGYTAEQVKLIRQLSDYSELANGSLKNLTDNITKNSGRENLIDALEMSIQNLVDIFGTIGKAWKNVFPPMTAEALYSITQSIRDFVESLTPSEETLQKLQRTFQGLFSILSIGKEALSALINAIGSLIGHFDGLGSSILDITATVGDWLYSLDQFIKKNDIFNNALSIIVTGLGYAIDIFKEFINILKEKVTSPGLEIIGTLLDNFKNRMLNLSDIAQTVKDNIVKSFDSVGDAIAKNNFANFLKSLWKVVQTVGAGISNILGTITSTLISGLSNANFTGILDTINTIIAGGIGVGIYKFINNLSDVFSDFQGIASNITGILNDIRGCFEAYQTQLKAGALLKIAAAIGILTTSIVVLSTIDSEKLSTSLGALTVMFTELMISMSVFTKISGLFTGVLRTTTMLIGVSAAILILASAVKKLGSLNFKELAVGLTGVAGLMTIVVAAAKIMGSGGKIILKGAIQMTIFAAAVKILASAAEDLADLSWGELAKGLSGVGILLAEISLFLNTAKFSGKAVLTATGIVILAGAIKILQSVCEDFSNMNVEGIAKGLISIGGLLTSLAVFVNLSGKASHIMTTGIALIEIAAALNILAAAFKQFGSMTWDEIAKGLISTATALSAITIAVNLMPKNLAGASASLVIISSSLIILAEAMKKMGGIEWDEIGRGLTVLGGSLGILVIGLNAMKGTLSGSAAMIVAAGALTILTPILRTLGSMSWTSIAKGLIALAGAFAVIGAAGALLTPVVPMILGLAGAMALIGASVLGFGVGLAAIGAGLSAIAIGITALVTALAGGATTIAASLTVIITGIAELIPTIVEKIGEAIIRFAKVIAEGAPQLGEAVKAVVLTLVDVLTECVPQIADGALQLLTGVLKALADYSPQIVDSIFQLLINILEGIAKRLPELIVASVDVILSFFKGVTDAMKNIDVGVLMEGLAGIGLLSAIMLALGAVAATIPAAMAGVLGVGVVIAEVALVLAAIGALAQIPGLDWLINEGGTLLEGVGKSIGRFIGGIIGGIAGGITDEFPKIANDLSLFMDNIQPFIDGARSIDASAIDGINSLAESILALTASNVLDSISSWFTGGKTLSTFAAELVPFGTAIKEFSLEIAGIDGELLYNAALAGEALANMAATIPNTGGLISFFTGDNDMEIFGSRLASFGKAMKEFSIEVSGMDASAVQNAAIAGEALAEMATTIPNTGGLVSFFTGNNDMDKFGKQLVAFGKSFSEYSKYISGVDSGIITATANAAESIVKLAKSLPDNKLFTNETTLDEFGKQLSKFGSHFASYYSRISSINAYVLSSVTNEIQKILKMVKDMSGIDMGSISDFADGLSDLGKIGIDGLVSAFTDANSRITSAINSLFNNVIKIINSYKSKLTEAFSRVISDSIKSVNVNKSAFMTAGKDFINNMINGIKSQQNNVVSAFKMVIDNCLSTIKNSNGRFSEAGRECINNFINGLRTNSYILINSFSMTEVVAGIRKNYNSFYNAGKYLVEGFANGIGANTYKASVKARAMAAAASNAARKELDEHSPSKVGYEIGDYFGIAFVNAIADNIKRSYDISSSMASAATDGLANGLSSSEELGKRLMKGVSEGIKSDMTAEEVAAQKAQNITEIFQEEFDKLDLADTAADLESQLTGQAINATKQYERQVARAQLALGKYEAMLKHLGETATETQEAYNSYLESLIELQQISFDHSMEWIEERKNASKLNLIEEYAAWKRIQSRYLEGTEQRIQADKEVLRVQEEIKDATEEYYNDLKTIEDEAEEKRSEINKNYEDERIRIKEEANDECLRLDQEYADKTREINEQLAADIEAAEKAYEDAVKSRSDTLYSAYGLFDEVTAGETVSGATLTNNLKDQLEAFENWTNDINSLADRGIDEALLEELRKMGPSSAAEIKALSMMTDEELDEYVELWKKKHELAKDQALFELEGMRDETDETIEQLKKDAEDELEEYRKIWKEQIEELNDNTERQLEELRDNWRQQIDDLDTETEEKLQDVRNTWMHNILGLSVETQNAFSIMTDQLVNTIGDRNKWDQVGINAISGVLKGIADHTPELVEGVEDAMREALDAANYVLGINSPSREFAKSGKYSIEGFVYGLNKYLYMITNAGKNMGTSALDTVRSVMAKIPDIMNMTDSQPTIRPVLDLSDVKSGVKSLNAMLSNQKALRLNTSINNRSSEKSKDNSYKTGGNIFEFTQNNYSPKALSRTEIYRQTKNQFSAMERMVTHD